MKHTMIRTEEIKLGHHHPLRLCRHTESGYIQTVKTCIYNYQCWHCPFDQWLDAMEERQMAVEDLKRSNNRLARAA